MNKLTQKELIIRVVITIGLFLAVYGGYLAHIANH